MGAGDVRIHFLPAHPVLYLFCACWQADLEWCGVVLVLGCEQQVHHCWDLEYYDRVGSLVSFIADGYVDTGYLLTIPQLCIRAPLDLVREGTANEQRRPRGSGRADVGYYQHSTADPMCK